MATAKKQQEPATPDPKEPKPLKSPGRGRRYKVFPDGDYMVLQVAPTDSGLPAGALVPIPEVPQFEGVAEAFAYLRNNGHLVEGMQLMVLRAHRILSVQATQKVSVELIEKPRALVSEPAEVE